MVAEVARSDAATAAAALDGLQRYQQAPRPPERWPEDAGEAIGRARLHRYRGDGPPVLLVPSLINPPRVLDMAADNSLARALADAGFGVHLLTWGPPSRGDAGDGLAEHVERYLLPAIARLGGSVQLVGHCLGGTLALGAAAVAPVASVATIAAPWNFDAYPGTMRVRLARLWQHNRHALEGVGLVPLELLQTAFWALDPERTVAKFARLADPHIAPDMLANFVALEDWANGGDPLPYAAGADLFEALFAANAPAKGAWQVAGQRIAGRPDDVPSLHFASTSDRIVPLAAVADWGERRDVDAGHIGMVVGRSARRQLWRPLIDWLGSHA
jgi:polyhydroxyalkanoate synthase